MEQLRWVSHVGDDASSGGGVAKAVGLFKILKILPTADYLSLKNISAVKQFYYAFKDIYFLKYKKFVLHSIFCPYTFAILIFPFKGSIVFLSHGELKYSALQISKNKKSFYLNFLRLTELYNRFFKKFSLLATNNEELEMLKSIFAKLEMVKVKDIVQTSILLQERMKFDEFSGTNIVIISRLVENKGVSYFLSKILKKVTESDSLGIESIYLFITPEDESETQLVLSYIKKIKTYKIKVNIFEGYDSNKIEKCIQELPNKLPFLCSRFESFSYVLLETLYFEYAPIVWFENELVFDLVNEGLCEKLPYGDLPGDFLRTSLKVQDAKIVSEFIHRISIESQAQYKEYFSNI